MSRRFKKFISSKAFKLLLLIFFFLAGFKFYLNYKKIEQIKGEIEILHNRIELSLERNEELKNELGNVNDPEYIEKIARKELGLVKPGELLLVPIEDEEEEKDNN